MLNLRQIEVFREVMRAGTTTGAAKTLTISQPAVSNAIRLMESQIGMSLFERAGNRMVPTSEAQEMFRDSEAIFSLYHAFLHRVEGLRRSEAGSLRILSTPPLANALIPDMLKRFLNPRPSVRVNLDTRRIDGVLEGIETGMADIGFAVAPPQRENVLQTQVATGEMVCAFPPGHPLENRSAVTAEDIRAFKLVLYEPKSRLNLMLQQSFLTADLQRNVVAEARYSSLACLLAEAGLGITIVDSFTAAVGKRYKLSYRPLHPAQPIEAFALTTASGAPKRLVRAMLAEIARSSTGSGHEDKAPARVASNG